MRQSRAAAIIRVQQRVSEQNLQIQATLRARLDLTESMDIFSMGCVLLELLTDGRHVAFNLSQSIDYSRMDEDVANRYLANMLSVCPVEFCDLISSMLDRDAQRRKERFEKVQTNFYSIFLQEQGFRRMLRTT